MGLRSLTTPLGITLSKGVKISASLYNSQTMPFLRCDRGGCYVQGTVEKDALNALGRSTAQAKLTVTGLDGRAAQLPFSLRGFGAALPAMETLARRSWPPPSRRLQRGAEAAPCLVWLIRQA